MLHGKAPNLTWIITRGYPYLRKHGRWCLELQHMLVGGDWNMTCIFPSIWNVIPIDSYFSEGWPNHQSHQSLFNKHKSVLLQLAIFGTSTSMAWFDICNLFIEHRHHMCNLLIVQSWWTLSMLLPNKKCRGATIQAFPTVVVYHVD